MVPTSSNCWQLYSWCTQKEDPKAPKGKSKREFVAMFETVNSFSNHERAGQCINIDRLYDQNSYLIQRLPQRLYIYIYIYPLKMMLLVRMKRNCSDSKHLFIWEMRWISIYGCGCGERIFWRIFSMWLYRSTCNNRFVLMPKSMVD